MITDENNRQEKKTGQSAALENLIGSDTGESKDGSGQEVKRFPDWIIYNIIIFIAAICLFWYFVLPNPSFIMADFWVGNLSRIGDDLFYYIENNDGKFPEPDKWCDIMLEAEERNEFTTYEKYREDFPYILNKHVYDTDELPDNMVVLFVGPRGWNQVGDYEMVKDSKYSAVLFADGSSESYKTRELKYLRWASEGSEEYPFPIAGTTFIIIAALFISSVLVYLVINRQVLLTFWIFALLMSIVTAVVNAGFGSLAEFAFYKSFRDQASFSFLFGLTGFLAGLVYVVMLGRILCRYHGRVKMTAPAVGIAMLTGLAASSVTHGFLMVAYHEKNISYMLAGWSFGIFAGLMLGLISSAAVLFYKNSPAVTGIETESYKVVK